MLLIQLSVVVSQGYVFVIGNMMAHVDFGHVYVEFHIDELVPLIDFRAHIAH